MIPSQRQRFESVVSGEPSNIQDFKTRTWWFAPLINYRKLPCTGASRVAVVIKNLPAKAGDIGSIPGWGRSPGGGHGNPFQYPCLKNPMDRGAWQAKVHRVTKSQTRLKWRSKHWALTGWNQELSQQGDFICFRFSNPASFANFHIFAHCPSFQTHTRTHTHTHESFKINLPSLISI